jgi:hypothetical protein
VVLRRWSRVLYNSTPSQFFNTLLDYAAAQENSKFSGLHAPATNSPPSLGSFFNSRVCRLHDVSIVGRRRALI